MLLMLTLCIPKGGGLLLLPPPPGEPTAMDDAQACTAACTSKEEHPNRPSQAAPPKQTCNAFHGV